MQAGASAVAVNDAGGDLGLLGGTVTGVVEAAMNASFLNARSVQTAAESTAAEFDRRAEVCADYTERMRRWRADLAAWHSRWAQYAYAPVGGPYVAPPGPQPVRPTRWPLWVEEG